MEKTKKIKRVKFLALLNGLVALADKGNLEFDDWLDVNETRIWLEEIMKREIKLYEKLKESTGYKDYCDKIADLHLRGVKNFKHSQVDIESIKKFESEKEKFEDSEVEIKYHPISKELMKKIPEEILSIRNALLPIVELVITEKK